MKISILLIEDDHDMRDLVAGHLEHSGFDVHNNEKWPITKNEVSTVLLTPM